MKRDFVYIASFLHYYLNNNTMVYLLKCSICSAGNLWSEGGVTAQLIRVLPRMNKTWISSQQHRNLLTQPCNPSTWEVLVEGPKV